MLWWQKKSKFGRTLHFYPATPKGACDVGEVLATLAGGHQIIERTQLSDVILFRALKTQICEICIHCCLPCDKLKPHS